MIDHVLKASLQRDWIVTIMYMKGSEITKRNIRVLEYDGDNIRAYCYLRGANRVFKKQNILSACFMNIEGSRVLSGKV